MEQRSFNKNGGGDYWS